MPEGLARRGDTTGITPDVFVGAGAPTAPTAAVTPPLAAPRATPDKHRPLTLDDLYVPAGAQNHRFSWISEILKNHRKIKVAKSVPIRF